MCLRNNESTLMSTFDQLKEVEEKLHNFEFYYYIYENDSHDSTKYLIKSFMKNRKGSYLLETLKNIHYGSESNLERSQFLARCRNKMKVLNNDRQNGLAIILDSDIKFCHSDVSYMITSLHSNKDIAMVTAFGHTSKSMYTYYDTYALLTRDYKQRLAKVGLPDIIEVHSAFGGLAMLPTSVFENCFWDPNQDILMSEHYSFCKMVAKFGRIVILKNVKVGWNMFKETTP